MTTDCTKHYALLSDGEPAPFRLHNAEGQAPILILSDHASRNVPKKLGQLGVSDEDFNKHIAYDIGAENVSTHLADLLDAPAVIAQFSRLVIDANRYPSDVGSIPEVSDNIQIPGNQNISTEQKMARVEELFMPYHFAVNAQLARFEAQGIKPVVFSVHSFTPEMDGEKRPWHLGFLWDKTPDLARKFVAYFTEQSDRPCAENQPYNGNAPGGFSMIQHGTLGGHETALVEIRQDLITSKSGQKQIAFELAEAVKAVILCISEAD